MTPARDEHAIDTLPRLEALLGTLSDASVHKELPYVHPAYRAMIAASPFAVLATTGPGGLDASPRGDPAGLRNGGQARSAAPFSSIAPMPSPW